MRGIQKNSQPKAEERVATKCFGGSLYITIT